MNDTIKIPEWAMGAIHNGDISMLEDNEIEMIHEFNQKYPAAIFVPTGESYFSHEPEFGLACMVHDHEVVYPQNK